MKCFFHSQYSSGFTTILSCQSVHVTANTLLKILYSCRTGRTLFVGVYHIPLPHHAVRFDLGNETAPLCSLERHTMIFVHIATIQLHDTCYGHITTLCSIYITPTTMAVTNKEIVTTNYKIYSSITGYKINTGEDMVKKYGRSHLQSL